MMLQRVRLHFTKRGKPPDDRRWAVSCEALWRHSVYVNDDTVRAIIEAVHAHAYNFAMRKPRGSFERNYHVVHQLEAVIGDQRSLPPTLWDEVVIPWMRTRGGSTALGLDHWG